MDRRDRSGRRDQEIRYARQIPLRCLSLAVEEGRLPTCPFQLEAAEPRSAPGRGSRCSPRPGGADRRFVPVKWGVSGGGGKKKRGAFFGGKPHPPPARRESGPPEECAMAKRIKKSERRPSCRT